MAGDKRREPAQVKRDRKRIADLYLKGWLQADIAQELGINQSTVSRDLTQIQKDWEQDALRDFDEARGRELAKIDLLEITYWEAWQRSIEKKEIETSKMVETAGGQRMEAATRTEAQPGDPRFLQGVMTCIDRRCKLMGLDAPERLEHSGAVEMIQIIEPVKPDDNSN